MYCSNKLVNDVWNICRDHTYLNIFYNKGKHPLKLKSRTGSNQAKLSSKLSVFKAFQVSELRIRDCGSSCALYLLGSIQHAESCLFYVYAVYFLSLIWTYPSFQKEEFAVKGKYITFLLKNVVLTPTMIIDSFLLLDTPNMVL
jgi:hypothetical protein